MAMRTFEPSTWEAEEGGSPSLRHKKHKRHWFNAVRLTMKEKAFEATRITYCLKKQIGHAPCLVTGSQDCLPRCLSFDLSFPFGQLDDIAVASQRVAD